MERALDRLRLTVDGDVMTAIPSLRAEIIAVKRELRTLSAELVKQRRAMQSFHHDLETYQRVLLQTENLAKELTDAMEGHARRDIWIHASQYAFLAILLVLIVVAYILVVTI